MTQAAPMNRRNPSRNPHAAALRAAGLIVTSARLAALRLAPAVLQAHGRLTPPIMYEAARRHGYAVSPSAFYQVLPVLASAGLLSLSQPPRAADPPAPVSVELD